MSFFLRVGFYSWAKSNFKILVVKFIYSEKATKFCEIFTLLLTDTTQDKVKILQNFVAFLEYMNITSYLLKFTKRQYYQY